MSVQVTFDLFSGRVNPSVTLDGSEAAELLRQLQAAAANAGGKVVQPGQPALGYRGLIIEQTPGAVTTGIPTRGRLAHGTLTTQSGSYQVQGSNIEEFVLASAAATKSPILTPDLAALIRGEIKLANAPKQAIPAVQTIPQPVVCSCAPLYEPGWWNDDGQIQLHNNCYNYACNYRTDSFAQPGRADGKRITAFSCAGVQPLAVDDALTVDTLSNTSKLIHCPPQGNLVALVIWPSWDFHWYRMGSNGYWSHKPGGSPVTNLDSNGALITDPRMAARGRYTSFCSFMIVMQGHVKIS